MKNNTPRRKRLNQQARLARAKDWIKSYTGKNLVKGYAKWFGVDILCAMRELKFSGVSFAPEYEQQILRPNSQRIEKKRRKKGLRALKLKEFNKSELWESDENFAFIIGYTSGGAPFGVTHDEWESKDCPDNYSNDDQFINDWLLLVKDNSGPCSELEQQPPMPAPEDLLELVSEEEQAAAISDQSVEPVHSQAEAMEKIMNQGMEFLTSLFKTINGKDTALENQRIEVDKKTGEVVFRFKLPQT